MTDRPETARHVHIVSDDRPLLPDDYETACKLRPVWLLCKVPPGARCADCGSLELEPHPTFSTGSGTAHRSLADDVTCRRCGHIGLPE